MRALAWTVAAAWSGGFALAPSYGLGSHGLAVNSEDAPGHVEARYSWAWQESVTSARSHKAHSEGGPPLILLVVCGIMLLVVISTIVALTWSSGDNPSTRLSTRSQYSDPLVQTVPPPAAQQSYERPPSGAIHFQQAHFQQAQYPVRPMPGSTAVIEGPTLPVASKEQSYRQPPLMGPSLERQRSPELRPAPSGTPQVERVDAQALGAESSPSMRDLQTDTSPQGSGYRSAPVAMSMPPGFIRQQQQGISPTSTSLSPAARGPSPRRQVMVPSQPQLRPVAQTAGNMGGSPVMQRMGSPVRFVRMGSSPVLSPTTRPPAAPPADKNE
mmetsp:Transcript_12771/g.30565  ORF Transcript_12771/g.30565 Transcript_12771/m.30565 type:complete len:327 (+) Transcript_12771:52-1032(+)